MHSFSSSTLQIPESVAEVSNHWVRFTSADPPLVLEAAVQIQAVPAEPATWTLRCRSLLLGSGALLG